jgi:hypothetical protein
MRLSSGQRNSIWLVVSGVVAVLILGFAGVQLAIGARSSVAVGSASPAATSDWCQQLFPGFPAGYPSAKRAFAERVVQRCEVGRQVPAATIPPNFTPPPDKPSGAQTQWRSGIIPQGQGPVPFQGGYYAITNQWQGLVDGMHVNVYAGSYGEMGPAPAQGLVVVFTTSPDFSFQNEHTWVAPPHVGALRIVAASGHMLTLVATDGQRFTFNAVPACGYYQPVITGDECQFVPVR